jgi:uncharacterized protein (UPF0303 family)
MQKQLVLKSFSNNKAMEIGLQILALAKIKDLVIGVEVCRLNHSVFLYLDDGLSADKCNWLRRKANVVKHFEESSLAVKEKLKSTGMSLNGTFGLDESNFIAFGGSMPIMVKNTGLVGAVTVTGLSDIEDHNLIVEALSTEYEFVD